MSVNRVTRQGFKVLLTGTQCTLSLWAFVQSLLTTWQVFFSSWPAETVPQFQDQRKCFFCISIWWACMCGCRRCVQATALVGVRGQLQAIITFTLRKVSALYARLAGPWTSRDSLVSAHWDWDAWATWPAFLRLQGTELRTSGCMGDTLTHWAISPFSSNISLRGLNECQFLFCKLSWCSYPTQKNCS